MVLARFFSGLAIFVCMVLVRFSLVLARLSIVLYS